MLFLPSPAFAGDRIARLVRVPDSPPKIAALLLPDDQLEVESRPFGDNDFQSFVVVEGRFVREGWTLLWNKEIVPLEPSGAFRIRVPISGPAEPLNLHAVGPAGELKEQKFALSIPDWENYRQQLKASPPQVTYFQAGAGLSLLSYTESNIPDVFETALTAKVSYSRLIAPPNWDFGASVYLTLTPITRNVDATARFLGINVRAGYVLPNVPPPWRVSLLAGAYYTTMFVTDNRFGFLNLAGPQLFPTVRRTFARGDSAGAYLKFSPVTDGINFLSLSNHELAGGLSYTRPLRNGHPISFSVDLAQLSLKLQDVAVSSTSCTFGSSYGF